MRFEGFLSFAEVVAAEESARERRPELFEDAAQEGRIAAWRVLEERPDASGPYVRTAVRRAVRDVFRGRPATGAPSHRGRQDAFDEAGPLEVEKSDGGVYLVAEPADRVAGDALEAVERREDVARLLEAVAGLPDRERFYVWARFWRDWAGADIARELGIARHTMELVWAQRTRPALRAVLEAA